MALSDVILSVQDRGLGITPFNAGRTQVKMGVCSKGTPNTLYSFGNSTSVDDVLGEGPLAEAVVHALDVAGGPVLAMPVTPSVAGAVGAVTLEGTGTGTITPSFGPDRVIRAKIILGGALGTMTYQVSVDGGAYSTTIVSAVHPYTYKPPGTLSTLSFGNVTYTAADIYTLNADGTVTRTGAGPATALDGSTHNPVDSFNLWAKITTAGGLGAGVFQYSLDGGNSWSPQIAIPSGGKYAIPETGLVLTFAGTFVKDDVYKVAITAAGFSTGDVNTALTALAARPEQWGWVHIVGKPSSAAGAASLTTTAQTQMAAAAVAQRYAFAIVECPQEEGDATIKTAFQNVIADRVMVCVGDANISMRSTGRTDRRNCAWAVAARLAKKKLSRSPAAVKDGPLENVTSIYRDEAATPGLDDARFTTVRTRQGRSGYYVNRGRMMAEAGSDFHSVMNRRVMDRACQIAAIAYGEYIEDDVRLDKKTGYIDPRDANSIDAIVTDKLKDDLIDAEEASSVVAQISRTTNIASTGKSPASVRAIPKGYLTEISVDIGFQNPALAT